MERSSEGGRMIRLAKAFLAFLMLFALLLIGLVVWSVFYGAFGSNLTTGLAILGLALLAWIISK